MLTLPALKIQQFAKEFYLLNLSAGDVERLVRFEVLGDAGIEGKKPHKPKATGVNWGELEKKVGTSDKAFQRPIIRKKIDELAQYYTSCRESDALPAIPGSVILTADEKIAFTAAGANPFGAQSGQRVIGQFDPIRQVRRIIHQGPFDCCAVGENGSDADRAAALR